MRGKKLVKAIAIASASVGLLSIFDARLHAGTSYTYNPTTGSATWETAGSWTPTPAAFPFVAGDTANFTATLTGVTTVSLATETVGNINVGGTSATNSLTVGTLNGFTLTLDNGDGSTVNITKDGNAGSAFVGKFGDVVANADVLITANSTAGAASRLRIGNGGTFTAAGHTVTITTHGSAKVVADEPMSAGLWVITSGSFLAPSGAANGHNICIGDIVCQTGSTLNPLEPNSQGLHELITLQGNANYLIGTGNGTNCSIGALAGDAASTAGDAGDLTDMTLNGTTAGDVNVVGTPNFSGTTALHSLTITGGTQILSGATANVTGTVNVSGGQLQLSKTAVAAISGPLNVTGGSVLLAQNGQLPAATVVTLSTGGSAALAANIGAQTIAGLSVDAANNSQLDINNNAVLVNYAGGANATPALRTAVMTGSAGSFTGPGINSSAAAASSGVSGIGYADGADGVVSGLASGTAEVKFTFLGDANLDSKVDVLDLDILAGGFGISTTNGKWTQGDFSYDGNVDVLDLDILATHFGDGTGITGAAAQALFASDLSAVEASNHAFAQAIGASVPEPAAVSLLILGAGSLMVRRRAKY